MFADGEVPVVAGYRAEKLDGFTVPMRHHVFNILIHQVKAAVAAHHHLLGFCADKLSAELPCLWNAENTAVVAYICAILQQVETLKNAIQIVGQVQLFSGRFPSREVQPQFSVDIGVKNIL